MLADFVFAVVIAIVVSAIVAALSGQRLAGRDTLAIFLLTLLIVWAVGAWMSPVGPVLWGAYWLSFLIPGILFLLLLAALSAPGSAHPRRPPVPTDPAHPGSGEAETALIVISVFFWILVVALIVAVIVAYV